ncbi:MAG: 50S ribosomal protein L21 [bacterium]|nr:50S ribosomal protein L21 [bacterium]
MKFAVIETGGKQYTVAPGDEIKIDRLEHDGDAIVFDKVLLADDGGTTSVGSPYVAGVKVTASVVEDGRDKKIVVFKYKNKTRSRVTRGHRQHFTKIKIDAIK